MEMKKVYIKPAVTKRGVLHNVAAVAPPPPVS
jgi:hypothetical protein